MESAPNDAELSSSAANEISRENLTTKSHLGPEEGGERKTVASDLQPEYKLNVPSPNLNSPSAESSSSVSAGSSPVILPVLIKSQALETGNELLQQAPADDISISFPEIKPPENGDEGIMAEGKEVPLVPSNPNTSQELLAATDPLRTPPRTLIADRTELTGKCGNSCCSCAPCVTSLIIMPLLNVNRQHHSASSVGTGQSSNCGSGGHGYINR